MIAFSYHSSQSYHINHSSHIASIGTQWSRYTLRYLGCGMLACVRSLRYLSLRRRQGPQVFSEPFSAPCAHGHTAHHISVLTVGA